MQSCSFRPTIDGVYAHQNIFGLILGVFHKHVEIAVTGEDAAVQ